MSRLDIEAHVAPMHDGWGIRLKIKGASCPAVWAGQGWGEDTSTPPGAHMAKDGRGWIFDRRDGATTYLDTIKAEQQVNS